MDAVHVVVCGLVVAGVGALGLAFAMADHIVAELPLGSVRQRWVVLRLLLLAFVVGYFGYLAMAPRQAPTGAIIVGVVFFLTGLFAFLVCALARETVRDLLRLATLERENVTDPLTGLANRRHFERRLAEELARTRRYALPLSLALLDIDHFKQVNDAHGHQVGDRVLSGLGQRLLESVRESDVVARYGGEELVLLMPSTDEGGALALAERIRELVETTVFAGLGAGPEEIRCTVSIGFTHTHDAGCAAEELIRQADVALYHAKRTGRNRVVAYQPELEVEAVTEAG